MAVMCQAILRVCIAGLVGCAFSQDTKTSEPTIPVLTVCEALNSMGQYDDKVVVVVGKFGATSEGSWLTEDCEQKITTDGVTWPNAISLSYSLSPDMVPPPRPPKGFDWNLTLLLTKLQQVQRTTKLQVLKQYHYTDKWYAVFGRFETVLPLQAKLRGTGQPFTYGFGHLNGSPAQLISSGDDYRELKPKRK